MADLSLSQLTQAVSVVTTDLVEISQDQGVEVYTNGSRKVTFTDFRSSILETFSGSVASFSTTATTFQTALTFNFTPSEIGDYIIHWSSIVGIDNKLNGAYMRILLDAVEIDQCQFRSQFNWTDSGVAGDGNRPNFGGVYLATGLTAASHTLTVELRSFDTGRTSYLVNTNVVITRG